MHLLFILCQCFVAWKSGILHFCLFLNLHKKMTVVWNCWTVLLKGVSARACIIWERFQFEDGVTAIVAVNRERARESQCVLSDIKTWLVSDRARDLDVSGVHRPMTEPSGLLFCMTTNTFLSHQLRALWLLQQQHGTTAHHAPARDVWKTCYAESYSSSGEIRRAVIFTSF